MICSPGTPRVAALRAIIAARSGRRSIATAGDQPGTVWRERQGIHPADMRLDDHRAHLTGGREIEDGQVTGQ